MNYLDYDELVMLSDYEIGYKYTDDNGGQLEEWLLDYIDFEAIGRNIRENARRKND